MRVKTNFLTILTMLVGTFILFTGCEDDVDLTEGGRSIPVVYGLIDASQETHLIKINKMFLGKGNAYETAKIKDSSEFVNLDAEIIELRSDSTNTGRSWKLKDTTIQGKESGTFYGPSQTAYYFKSRTLNDDMLYQIKLNTGNDINSKATTDLCEVKDVNFFTTIGRLQVSRIDIIDNTSGSNKLKLSVKIGVDVPKRSKIIQLKAYFNYENKYNDGSFKQFTVPITIGNSIIDDPTYINPVDFDLNPELIFTKLQDNVPDFEDVENISNRFIKSIQYELTVANEAFYIYMITHEPTDELFQEKPDFTNLTNGRGIFASRSIYFDSTEYCFNSKAINEMTSPTIINRNTGETFLGKKGFQSPISGCI